MIQNEALQNPRVIVVQKLYGNHLNKGSELIFPKHRYRKFIKDVVLGTIERREIIQDLMVYLKNLEKNLDPDISQIVKIYIGKK